LTLEILIYLYTFRIDKRFSDWGRVFGIEFFQIPVLSPILELGEKVFPGEVGSGEWVGLINESTLL
jgi:hypothetical protein